MTYRVTLEEALSRIPTAEGSRFAPMMAHGTLEVEIYAPRGTDPQSPHTKDELYVVMSGRGAFLRGDERIPFAPGDVLFVPAGMVHRFEAFTDDFAVWVIFWGPEGGEDANYAGDAPLD